MTCFFFTLNMRFYQILLFFCCFHGCTKVRSDDKDATTIKIENIDEQNVSKLQDIIVRQRIEYTSATLTSHNLESNNTYFDVYNRIRKSSLTQILVFFGILSAFIFILMILIIYGKYNDDSIFELVGFCGPILIIIFLSWLLCHLCCKENFG